MSSERSIIPPTSKITARGPVASSAARNDPAPASLRFVTRRIAPPRPAAVVVPNPIAPGNTGNGPEDAVRTVIDAAPAVFAVTSPLPFTVATVVLFEDHVTVRPVRMLPLASLSVAVSCCVWPACTLADAGLTVTVATGAVTVILAVPLLPSLVAVIVTGPPAATPVTSPLPFTLAIVLSLDAQVITRPVSGLPFASVGVALSCAVCPVATLAVAGATVTVATGTGVTVIRAVPLFPSLVAVIVAEPAVAAATGPPPVTVATVALCEDHVTVPPVGMV